MNGKKWAAAAAVVVPVGIMVAAPMAGADTVNIPAPPGIVDTVAAQITGLLGISHVHAEAHPTAPASNATANVLEIGGKPLLGVLGTQQNGVGESSNKLLDTKDILPSLPVRVEVTPSHAKVAEANGCRTASGAAAVARVTLGDDNNKLNVLQGQGEASHCDPTLRSKSNGSTDGVKLDLGGKTLLDLLHSEGGSDQVGHTYVANIAGSELLNNDQAGKACSLTVPNLLDLTCLTAGGGLGTVFSNLLHAGVGNGALGANVAAVTSTSGSGTAGTGNGAAATAPAATSTAAKPKSTGKLAFTGLQTDLLALAAAGLIGIGGLMLAAERKRQAQEL